MKFFWVVQGFCGFGVTGCWVLLRAFCSGLGGLRFEVLEVLALESRV